MIQGKEIDQRNCRKRVPDLRQIGVTGEPRRDGAHRPAMLYRVKEPGKVKDYRVQWSGMLLAQRGRRHRPQRPSIATVASL